MKSGTRGHPEADTPLRPMRLTVLVMGPAEGRTPWWSRRLRFTHIVVVLGSYVWTQPWKIKKGPERNPNRYGRCRGLAKYIEQCGFDRDYCQHVVEVEDHDPDAWAEACEAIEGRKSQRLRTVLRYLRLWPRPAWNCTSPVRVLLAGLGIEAKGETPDAIIEELWERYPDDRGDDLEELD